MPIKRIIFLITMTLILCVMTLGYAALQERIDVEVKADIDSTYRVEITEVQVGTSVGDARSTSAPSYNNLTATFNVGLTNDSDYITYTIEITNYSTVDIRLNNVEINTINNNIKVTKIGISNGDIILAGSTKIFTVKMKLIDTTSSEQTGTITVVSEFTRLKGGTGSVVEEVYDEYEIGDVITFVGSNWYVIEDSPSSSDYVTVIKETVLTATEITSEYTYNSGNTMAYYWSSTCHQIATYGNITYDTRDTSGCGGHSDYEGSKIREMLEGTYMPTLGAINLKEVNGYKIRLITLDELVEKFDYEYVDSSKYKATSTTPNWIHTAQYWTMTPYGGGTVWFVRSRYSDIQHFSVFNNQFYSVCPVINLYKSAIE